MANSVTKMRMKSVFCASLLSEAHDYYNDFLQKVKTNFFFFAEIKMDVKKAG